METSPFVSKSMSSSETPPTPSYYYAEPRHSHSYKLQNAKVRRLAPEVRFTPGIKIISKLYIRLLKDLRQKLAVEFHLLFDLLTEVFLN